jgi:hypothetical protein
MIRFKTLNVDGQLVEREYQSIAEIIKNWWSEGKTELPGEDDKVVELVIGGKSLQSPILFGSLIHELEEIYWQDIVI